MEKLKEILESIRPDIDFDIEKNLIDDGLIDSFDMIHIIDDIERIFNVKIGVFDLTPMNFNSLDSLYHLVQHYLEAS